MSDFALLAKSFRHCGNGGKCSDCPAYQRDHFCPDIDGRIIAADAIEELLAAVPQWISVEEKPPRETIPGMERFSVDVLGTDGYVVFPAYYDFTIEEWCYDADVDEITSWLQPPAPPKGGQDDATD